MRKCLKAFCASCSFAYYDSYWCWRSLALGELCLLWHKIITNPLWDILATGVAVIKLKHIKLGKPDTQEHYPSKGEGTPATAQSKERVKGPPHPRPKQDDRQQKLLVPTNQNVQWKKVCAAWYENPKNHMGKIGNVSPNQCSHTKPLGVKGKKDTTLKIKKVNVRELRWIYMYYNHPTVYTLQQ